MFAALLGEKFNEFLVSVALSRCTTNTNVQRYMYACVGIINVNVYEFEHFKYISSATDAHQWVDVNSIRHKGTRDGK